jgi:site-specific recombinase XerD
VSLLASFKHAYYHADMNAMLILTFSYVESLPPKSKEYFKRDTSISGFAAKVLPSGKKTYNFEYSQDSKTKRLKLGDHLDEASFVTAKKMAGEYRVALAKHEDPTTLHQRNLINATTYDDLCNEYKKHLSRLRTKGKTQLVYIDNYITPHLSGYNLESITPLVIRKMLATAPRELVAHSVHSTFRAMWNYGIKKGLTEMMNPTATVVVNKNCKTRAKAISVNEYKIILDAINSTEHHNPLIPLILKACIFSGHRIGEILTLNYFSYARDRDSRALLINEHKTIDIQPDNKFMHLSDELMDILDSAYEHVKQLRTIPDSPIHGNCYLFPSIGKHGEISKGHTSYNTVRNFLEKINNKTGLKLTIHNLRSGFISFAASQGLTAEQISTVTGQSVEVIHRHYLRFLAKDSLKYSQEITSALSGAINNQ